jgi:phosphoribosyl 1,2-cyclic phosphodiesterase
MADKFLIRAFNVAVGDCIYCRIPKARKKGATIDDFHILIDCGSRGGAAQLKSAITSLKGMLPDAGGGKVRLDLLVATHEHADHIKGFDPDDFDGIKIENIWLSVAMDPAHPQAANAMRLQGLAARAMRNIAARNLSLSPELQGIFDLYGVGNDDAVQALGTTLPNRNGITPVYVHADRTPAELRIDTLVGATIKVLGPEENIDRYYLGVEGAEIVHGFTQTTGVFRSPADAVEIVPSNISQSDFRRLRSRMMSAALAFAQDNDKVINNTSAVLLIEWKQKRLLFVGDAEWTNKFVDGNQNGSWNVMWNLRKADLAKPLDFLKIGHHGSENATPWSEDGVAGSEPARILDAILPLPQGNVQATAKALVSTARTNTYAPIPRALLLEQLGKRVSNGRNYQAELGDSRASALLRYDDLEKPWLDKLQPMRTDLEKILTDKDFVDVEIEA